MMKRSVSHEHTANRPNTQAGHHDPSRSPDDGTGSPKKHLRVAPYCRVSTDKEEQLSSYEAQIEYYTEKIDSNPDWTMVRLYADEGITGTSAKNERISSR